MLATRSPEAGARIWDTLRLTSLWGGYRNYRIRSGALNINKIILVFKYFIDLEQVNTSFLSVATVKQGKEGFIHIILPAAQVSTTPYCLSLPLWALISGSCSTFSWMDDVLLTCAWRSHTMNPAHIIWPKSQWGVVDTWAVGSMGFTCYSITGWVLCKGLAGLYIVYVCSR